MSSARAQVLLRHALNHYADEVNKLREDSEIQFEREFPNAEIGNISNKIKEVIRDIPPQSHYLGIFYQRNLKLDSVRSGDTSV